MRKSMFWLTLIVFIAVFSYAGRTRSEPPLPQDMSARCMATVPSEYGEYGLVEEAE
jgi:hypothetical protein